MYKDFMEINDKDTNKEKLTKNMYWKFPNEEI